MTRLGRRSPALPWLALSLLVWVAGVASARLSATATAPPQPPWQRSYLELTDGQQRLYRALREGLFEAENVRAETKRWPAPAELAQEGVEPFAPGSLMPRAQWSLEREGQYVNYLGRTDELEWLVLVIEPDPADRSAPPADDEEHHTIPDGTALHVSVWTRTPTPESEVAAGEVLTFPAPRGWTQRVGQTP